ncbi:MAG: hypothetical protein Kow0063_18710 [Anaerolineae bacterium]
MVRQVAAVRELEVPWTLDVDRLPLQLLGSECYTLIGEDSVLIECKGKSPVLAVFDRGKDRIICNCPQARCDHQQALSRGLWARLVALPRNRALLTYTKDWCEQAIVPTPTRSLLERSRYGVGTLDWRPGRNGVQSEVTTEGSRIY